MILEINTRKMEPGITVVELVGRLTLGNMLRTVEDQVKKIVEIPGTKAVLDISKLDFVDSAGLGMLVACQSAAVNAGSKLHLAGATERVKVVFEMTRLDMVLKLFPDLDAAIAGL